MANVLVDSTLPVPVPVPNPDTEEFWAATLEGRLLLTHCNACDRPIWYPRPICPFCHSTDTSWVEASGRGHIYSFSVVRRAAGTWGEVTPYVLAYVELEEGPRVMTNIVEADPERVDIGDPVEVVFFQTGEDSALPRFRPRTETT